jgi:amidase
MSVTPRKSVLIYLLEHPGQQVLEDAIKSEAMTDEEYNHGLKLLRGTAISGIKKTFKDFGVDVIMGPADARFASVAACAGFPVASVPLGFADFNGRAFGMSIIAGAGGEGDILRVMSAWEVTFPEGRQPPPMLVNWQAAANVARSSSF